jgi:hypothetical protein
VLEEKESGGGEAVLTAARAFYRKQKGKGFHM